MATTAEKTDQKLWERVKAEVTRGAKGGKPGQWSARKAQLASHDYQAKGGGYEGGRDADNSLHRWTEEDWGTKSGKESGETGERYLPKKAREHLSEKDYARTTARKRCDTKKGRQFSPQPGDIAERTAKDRRKGKAKASGEATKAALYAEAKTRGIDGRSRMSKAELAKALGRAA